MKIAMLTNALYGSMPDWVAFTDLLKCRYCGAYGIDYVRTAANPHPELRPEWQKPKVILDAMKAGHDWIIWMDCDAAPINIGYDVRPYLAGVGDHVVMMKDIMGWNSGVFALPNTTRGRRWMTLIESMRNDKRYHQGVYEQTAIAETFDMDEWRDFVVEPPREIGWNNYLELYGQRGDPNLFRVGHWTLHVPAGSDQIRSSIFREFVKAVMNAKQS